MASYPGTFESGAGELARALEESVRSAVVGADRVAVAFSGGLDSSVLVACAKRATAVVASTAAVDGSLDLEKAEEAAALMGVELVTTKLTPDMLKKELQRMRLPFEPTAMDASLWCLYSAVARSAAEAGAKILLLGQLADELFGGYAKYRAALAEEGDEKAEEMMRMDVEGYAGRGRIRDVGACSRWVQPKFPFETQGVVQLGLAFPVTFKISRDDTKLVLRRAAVLLGVPEELTKTPKKAAQYSSGVQKAITRTSLFNDGNSEAQHDSIVAAEGEAGGVQASSGEVQLLRPG